MHPSLLALLGLTMLAIAWLPLFIRRLPVTLAMLAGATGFLLSELTGTGFLVLAHQELAEQAVNFVLIVAVMGTGLAIDRPFGLGAWGSTWRLLGIAMPLSIVAIGAAGYWLLDLPAGVAVLLGGILAPTDPVLARAVQVGPPGTGEEGEIRFALTSEAGLNDGLAFPFVLLGLTMIPHGEDPWLRWFGPWLVVDIAWKIPAAVATGVALGWLLVAADRRLPERFRLPRSRDGFVAIGLAFIAYGLADLAQAYGLVAVFATAATLRNFGGIIEYERRLHESAERAERLAMVFVLAFFGAAIAGGLLSPVTWRDGLFTLLVLFVIRPLACLAGFAGTALPLPERLSLGLLGIRGLGSLFYMAYALGHGLPDRWGRPLWAEVALIVLVSLIVYGAGADQIMQRLRTGGGSRNPGR